MKVIEQQKRSCVAKEIMKVTTTNCNKNVK